MPSYIVCYETPDMPNYAEYETGDLGMAMQKAQFAIEEGGWADISDGELEYDPWDGSFNPIPF